MIDQTGVIRWTNRAAQRALGPTSAAASSRRWSHPRTRGARARSSPRRSPGTALVTDSEAVLIDADGARVSVEISSVPLHRGDRLIGVFGQFVEQDDVPHPHAHPALTPRQTEILRELQRGRSTRQIADELHLSPDTVRNHVRHVLKALGVHSRLEAVAVARREHLIAN